MVPMIPIEILVAEDDRTDAYFLNEVFIRSGIQANIKFVRDGQEAVWYLKGEKEFSDRTANPFPQILLLDLKMPRMDGFDVLDWIRGQAQCRRLKIIVLSSSAELQDIDRAYDLGASSYLTKPTGAPAMVDMVRRLKEYWLELNRFPQRVVTE